MDADRQCATRLKADEVKVITERTRALRVTRWGFAACPQSSASAPVHPWGLLRSFR